VSLETETAYWLKCDDDGCHETYGKPGTPRVRSGPYSWTGLLQQHARTEGWVITSDEDGLDSALTYCSSCALRLGLVPLTPIQQAVLMHGKKVVLA
jgi:hypothetical protein